MPGTNEILNFVTTFGPGRNEAEVQEWSSSTVGHPNPLSNGTKAGLTGAGSGTAAGTITPDGTNVTAAPVVGAASCDAAGVFSVTLAQAMTDPGHVAVIRFATGWTPNGFLVNAFNVTQGTPVGAAALQSLSANVGVTLASGGAMGDVIYVTYMSVP